MKASDYVADFIAKQGVRHVFGVTGAHIIHTIDSICRHPDLEFVPCAHEQGAAFAADAYARVTGGLGVAVSTSGPGAVNLVSGAASAFFDSVPVLFITGQVTTNQLRHNIKLRQQGFQETDIPAIFTPVTKQAHIVTSASNLRHELASAVTVACSGRPGAVLLDIPDDVQRAEMTDIPAVLIPRQAAGDKLALRLPQARRPLLILGAGVHQAKAEIAMFALVESLGWPVLLTWGGMDLLPAAHPLNCGGFGTCGPAAGNLALAEADCVLVLGAKLGPQETGNSIATFAARAHIIIVDCDHEELAKLQRTGVDLGRLSLYHASLNSMDVTRCQIDPAWLARIRGWRWQYPVGDSICQDTVGAANPYRILRELNEASQEGDIILTDAGATLCWTMQTWRVKEEQRLISSWNHSPMGWALPAAIGAAKAAPDRRVIAIMGDGSFQMNVQELATIRRHKLNVKLVVLDNHGYGIIRQTQDMWLWGRYHASGWNTLPYAPWADAQAIARIYYIESSLNPSMDALFRDGPGLLHYQIAPEARIVPKLARGRLEEIVPAEVTS